MFEINTYPKHKKILCSKTIPIELSLLKEFSPFIDAMVKFVEEDDNAVGLAANQVWKKDPEKYRCPRIFVMGLATGQARAFINPTVSFSGPTIKYAEACLSLPGKTFQVKRSKNCTVHYFDIQGEEKIEKYGGVYAQIIGHEMDHLDGKILKREIKVR